MYSICSSSLVTTSKLVGDISQVLWPVKSKKETHTHPISRGDEGTAKNKKCLRIFVCNVIWVLWASVPLDTSFVHNQLPALSPLPPSLASSSFLHFHCTFCTFCTFFAIPFAFLAIFSAPYTFFLHLQLPALSLFPLSLFLLVLSLVCIFIHFWGGSRTYIHRPWPTSSIITAPYISCFFPTLAFVCTSCTFSAFPGKSSTKKTRKKALIRKETPEICLKQLKSATSPKTY